jgi:hypothetical protein
MRVSKALLLECEHSYAWSCTPYLWLLACLDLRCGCPGKVFAASKSPWPQAHGRLCV